MDRRKFLALVPGFALAPFAVKAAGHVAPVDVAIKGFKFDPEVIEVTKGHKVRWTNMDGAPHTATADDESFDTKRLKKGATSEIKFDTPGTYTYYCRFHRKMKGTVVVV